MPQKASNVKSDTTRSGKDCFGLWLAPGELAAPPPPGSGTGPAAGTSPDLAAVRAFRAGKGPLASVVRGVDTALAPLADPGRGKGRPVRARQFRRADRMAALVLIAMVALVVSGSYALRADLRELSSLQTLADQNEAIREYNHNRNVLVQHLARGRGGEAARLRSYAAWMDQKTDQGVILFTPNGPPMTVQNTVRVDLGDLRRKVEDDIETVVSWTPPPLVAGYDDLRFTTAELLGSRMPTGGLMLLVLVGLVAWSALAYENLSLLEAPVGWTRGRMVCLLWLVPLVNLYMPWQIVSDIWRGSDPRTLRHPKTFHLPVVGLWWIMLLGTLGLAAYGTFRMADALGIATMVHATRFGLYADVAAILTGVVTGGIVAAATWNQSRRRHLVRTMQEQLGPSSVWRAE